MTPEHLDLLLSYSGVRRSGGVVMELDFLYVIDWLEGVITEHDRVGGRILCHDEPITRRLGYVVGDCSFRISIDVVSSRRGWPMEAVGRPMPDDLIRTAVGRFNLSLNPHVIRQIVDGHRQAQRVAR